MFSRALFSLLFLLALSMDGNSAEKPVSLQSLQEELDAGYGKIIYSDYIQAIDKYLIPFFNAKHIDSLNYNTHNINLPIKTIEHW